MVVALVFALGLVAAVLVSDRAARTALSTAVLFLLLGFGVGESGLGLLRVDPRQPLVAHVAELAIFSTLFADGLRLDLGKLAATWRLPGRALLLGLPLTCAGAALLGRGLLGLTWQDAAVLGAVLSPTDPVFAAALVRHKELSPDLRELLNVESGLNDGLALPLLLLFLASGHPGGGVGALILPLAAGVAIGVAIPWMVDRLERSRAFGADPEYRPLAAIGLGMLVYTVSRLARANEFLAAFPAGMTAVTLRPGLSREFRTFAEGTADLLKFGGIFVFGALLSVRFFAETPGRTYLFAALVLVAVRPLAITIALLGSRLDWRDRAAAAWFGPKGFSSVLYAVYVLNAGRPGGTAVFDAAAVVIALSVVAHSSTDVLAARWLTAHARRARQACEARHGAPEVGGAMKNHGVP
ncbi:MAG TPA: cation:proton antiporter [Gemmatimonadales bacterium]|nr:cation:proton antiporter [Gemmatimonadales bacterium]